jgi:copper resistance protein C
MKRILIMTGMMILGAHAVQAHTHLESSVPADKSTVATPRVIELQFSEAARVTALTVQKGESVAKNLGPLPAKAANHVSVPVTALTAGSYTATWRVVGEDGHVMSGKFQFTVDPAATDTQRH